MSQRNLVLLVTAVLLLAIGGVGIYKHRQETPRPTAANAIVTTGVSISLSAPLSTDAQLTVKNAAGKQVVSQKLEANAQRFNVLLAPGVYKIELAQKNIPPVISNAVTVSDGRLTPIEIQLPQGE